MAQQAEQRRLGVPWNGLGWNLVKAKLRATLTRISILWYLPDGIFSLVTTLDELVKAQPRVLERAAKSGTQAWLLKDSQNILQGQWGYS